MKGRPRIVLVGGFLGAGKTTLLVAASRELDRRGMRSALILNDQGDELVDTGFVSIQGLLAKDVKGGCFCCRFSDLVREIDELAAFSFEDALKAADLLVPECEIVCDGGHPL